MQPNLSIKDLENLPIPSPPIDEQQAIVNELEALATETQRLEAIYQQKLIDLADLK